MRWLKVITPIGLLALAAVATWQLSNMKPEPAKSEKPATPLVVETKPFVEETVQFHVSSQGTINPRTETTLISQVAGTVLEISPTFVSGGTFKKGDILLRIDPIDYKVAVEQAKAQLAQAEAKLMEEQGKAEAARTDWTQRGRSLKQANDLVLRKPYVQEAKAAVHAAKADLHKAQQYLSRTEIRAPYDGMTKARQVDVGQYVTTGAQLGDTFATDYAEIRLPIKRSDMPYLDLPQYGQSEFQGPKVILTSIHNPDHEWQAVITRQEAVVDTKTRMHYLVARIKDPYSLSATAKQESQQVPLPIGSFVKATITGVAAENVIKIPRHLLINRQQVLVIDQDDTLRIRPVKLIREQRASAFIKNNFSEGDRLCLTAIPNPIPGLQVSITDSEQQSTVAIKSTQTSANKETSSNLTPSSEG
ncbi:efflux RND transporter periplasmic adaptor subunit [Zooshikella marina]|uniref:efflux RND transporter periplasmic adaptor subunit n=1 Tax=Zooshikella ganghwensis TaxID=202772 RepID=UPI001BAF0575|nr:efflux RND transporter periplasmic adaptor subunit [Zooshikella ganghwensis]MBU2707393.1 efflux RND transporter periplasmic adaptor subunit [Zooshikella ganghwensis]